MLQAIENGMPSVDTFHRRAQQFMAARGIIHQTD
jgi:hypothetical protein